MSLLHHSEVKNTGKKLLTRGPKIETANKVNRSDIEKKPTVNEPSSKEKNVLSSYVTEPVNIRVDNHIRNYLVRFLKAHLHYPYQMKLQLH